MIVYALMSVILGAFSLFADKLPVVNQTVLNTEITIVNNYIIPMFAMMKAWLPMDTLYFWAGFTISLHILVIGYKLLGRLLYIASGGLLKFNHL